MKGHKKNHKKKPILDFDVNKHHVHITINELLLPLAILCGAVIIAGSVISLKNSMEYSDYKKMDGYNKKIEIRNGGAKLDWWD